jgi:hypothetical protein
MLRLLRKPIFALAVLFALLFPSIAPPLTSAHTGYESVYATYTGNSYYYADFYISPHTWHYSEQTYPDNVQCYHRYILRATGQILAAAWLWGDGHYADHHGATIGVYNNNDVSVAFRHSVSGCRGQIQVYNFHGT